MNKISKNIEGAFPDEETFQKIYEECLENEPQASEYVRESYKKIGHMFDEYICAVQEDIFRYAYQCGYGAGQKGGTVNG